MCSDIREVMMYENNCMYGYTLSLYVIGLLELTQCHNVYKRVDPLG